MLRDIATPFVLVLSVLIAIPTGNYDRYQTRSYHYEFPVLSAKDAKTVIDDIESEFPSPFFAIRTTAHLYKVDRLTNQRTEVALDVPTSPQQFDLRLEWAPPKGE